MKIQGQDIITLATRRLAQRLIVVSSIVFIVKGYVVDLTDLGVLGVGLPNANVLFDVTAFAILVFTVIMFLYSWVADVVAFRLWYEKSQIVMKPFNTLQDVDGSFFSEGVQPFIAFVKRGLSSKYPAHKMEELTDEERERIEELPANIEKYIARLAAHQRDFSIVSWVGRLYVFVFFGAVPLLATTVGLYILLRYGTLAWPTF